MKTILSALAIILFIIPASSHAASLSSWNIVASINDDKTVDMDITMTYSENITKTDYFVLAKVSHVGVYADNEIAKCDVQERDIGTLIVCSNIHASRIDFQLKAHGLVEKLGNFDIFKYKFPVTQPTGQFTVSINLPVGAVLVEEDKLKNTGMKPFEPSDGKGGSDGRIIYVSWKKDNPKLGDVLDVYMVYEKTTDIVSVVSFIVTLPVIIIIVVIATVWILLSRKPFTQILPVLTADERKLVEILMKDKKPVEQRMLVRELDCSKSKLTRIIKNLEERGVVEKISRGRSNKIKLVRSFHTKKEGKKE